MNSCFRRKDSGGTLKPIVSLHAGLGLTVYFLGGINPEEILEVTGFPVDEDAKSPAWSLPVIKVSPGHLLTEFTAGRLPGASPSEMDFLNDLALTYLAENGQEPPGTPKSMVEWHRDKPDPLMRYRDEWQSYYRSVGGRLEKTKKPSNESRPYDLYTRVKELERFIVNPGPMIVYWQEKGLKRVDPRHLPLVRFLSPDDSFHAALVEVWWCIENRKIARRCKDCNGWFVPVGIRWWRQRYCAIHREDSAARQRARRKKN